MKKRERKSPICQHNLLHLHQSASASESASTPIKSGHKNSTSSSTSSSGSSVDLLAHKKAKEDAEAAKVQAKEKASAYLRDHPNAGKSTVRDDGYYEILKEGGP